MLSLSTNTIDQNCLYETQYYHNMIKLSSIQLDHRLAVLLWCWGAAVMLSCRAAVGLGAVY